MMIEDAFSEVEKAAGPKSICRIFDVEQFSDGMIRIGNTEIKSSSLSRNLKGCERWCFLALHLVPGWIS